MPEYIVKTIRDRNLVIEAEKYQFNHNENAYEFFKEGGLAASVPGSPEILAIVEKNAEKADFYDRFDFQEEDEKDNTQEEDSVCDTCDHIDDHIEDFLDSTSFQQAVFGLINAYIQANFHDGKFISEESDAGAQL